MKQVKHNLINILNIEKELNNDFEINFCANFLVETFKNEINGVLLDYTSYVHMFINIKKEILDGFWNIVIIV